MRTWNRAGILPRAARSVLGQTAPDLELIIVDDASTDGTAEAIRSLQRSDERVLTVRRTVNSRALARRHEPMNEGLKICRGEFIAHLDDDNVWDPFFLQELLDVLERDPSKLIAYSDSCNHLSEPRLRRVLRDDRRSLRFVGKTCFVAPHLPTFRRFERFDSTFSYVDYIDTNEMLVRAAALRGVGSCWLPHPRAAVINRYQGEEFGYRTHADIHFVERVMGRFGSTCLVSLPRVLCHYIEHTHGFHSDPEFDPIATARRQGLREEERRACAS
jgi:glycosyltransferase involved in cell wall biosynthesis